MVNRISPVTPSQVGPPIFQKKIYAVLFAVGFILFVAGLSRGIPPLLSDPKNIYGLSMCGMAIVGIAIMGVSLCLRSSLKQPVISSQNPVISPQEEEFAYLLRQSQLMAENDLTDTPEAEEIQNELNRFCESHPEFRSRVSQPHHRNPRREPTPREELNASLYHYNQLKQKGLEDCREAREILRKIDTLCEENEFNRTLPSFEENPLRIQKEQFTALCRTYYDALDISRSKSHPGTLKAKQALLDFCKSFPEFFSELPSFS